MSSQLRSRFVLHLLTKIQLEKNITCHYNERAHGNGIGGIVKNLVIRKAKFGHCITGSYTLTVCLMYQRNL